MKNLVRLIGLASALVARAEDGFVLTDSKGDHLDVSVNGKVIGRYMYAHDTSTGARRAETYKPFLHVFDPLGAAPITKGAGGDFTHHRGIFIGFSKLSVGGKSYDRWHMSGGEQIHRSFSGEKSGRDGASFVSHVSWMGAGDQPVLEEERTLSFLPPPSPAYAMIDMVSSLKAVAGEAKLDGDPEHAGLQYRPAQEVDRTKTTYFFPVEAPDPHKQKDYPWFGETYELAGRRYSVVFLNHPSNPKDAAISAYRNYGRFGLFPKATIPAGGTQAIRARFLICEGAMPAAEVIQKAWNEYAGRNDATPASGVRPAEGSAPAAPKKTAPQPDKKKVN